MKKMYYLGPKGSYSEVCANKIKQILKEELELIPVSTINKIVEITQNEDSCAVLPIENSIEGIVRPTIDSLLASGLKIQAQTEIEINHCLFSNGNKNDIKNIISHPQALAQCSKYILDNFDKEIKLISASSTSAAAHELVKLDEKHATICSFNIGNELGLRLIEKNIQDNKDNKTRFVLVSKKDVNLGVKTRSSIVFNTKNESGALLEVLEIFKKHFLNLVYIESRPSKKVFGEYNFFVDIDKDVEKLDIVVKEVKDKCNFYKFLGSYPSV